MQGISIGASNALTPGVVKYNSSGATYLNPIIVCDGKGGGLQFWKNGNNGDGMLCAWTISGNTVDLAGGVQPSNNGSHPNDHGTTDFCYDEQRDVFMLAYMNSSNIYCDTYTRSGASSSYQHNINIATSNNNTRVTVAYNSVDKNILITYRDPGTWLRIRSLTINSSNQMVQGGTTLIKNSSTMRIQATYQAQVNKFYVLDRATNPSAALDIIVVNENATSVDSNINNIGGNNDVRATIASVGGGQIVQTLTDATDSEVSSTVRQFAHSQQTITPTTSNFIGFSAGAYTDGQTAKIKIVGNTITKAGLTLLGQYYITGIGTISSTAGSPSIKAGMAISSNTLLIDPPYGS